MFKPGDAVKCIDNSGRTADIKLNEVYIVSQTFSDKRLKLKGFPIAFAFYDSRFILVHKNINPEDFYV